jgi:Secretion system C-terminal sorting domain
LPVELSRFSGKEEAGEVFLFWQTASESNNDYFQIEHSLDGRTFQPIGKVWGNGSTSEKQEYSFVHTQPEQGLNYYRLKQVDFDGKYEYSKIININIEFDDVFIQPNPTTGVVEIKGLNLEQASLKITDGMGRLIQTNKLSEYQTINLSDHAKGIYFFIIQTARRTIVKRIIVE